MINEELELLSTENLIEELLRRKNWAGVFIRVSDEYKGIVGTIQWHDKWDMDYRNMKADQVMKLLGYWIPLVDQHRHTERMDY